MNARTLNSRPLSHLLLWVILCLVLSCPLPPCLAFAQTTQKATREVDDAIARINTGEFGPGDVVIIAKSGATQAIPALENRFERSKDDDLKISIASGLVKLKVRDDGYWNFLLRQATQAVDSNVPDAAYSESLGKGASPTPELTAWANAHNLSINMALKSVAFDYPSKVLELATTGDPRGVPLLRRALHCRNYLIVLWAARGLVQIQDKPSIPLIIAAAREAPAGLASNIAESLIWFDDAQAQSAVDTYMSKDRAKIFRDARAQGMGVFGW